MRKFLQDYGKHILAVVSVGLMIAWVLPSNWKQGGLGRNPVVGYVGKEKIRAQDKYIARNEWDLLHKQRLDPQGRTLATLLLGPIATSQIDAHPELFLLLLSEAKQMNVQASGDDVETVVRNFLPSLNDDALEARYRQAIADTLLVRAAFMRTASAIKVSEPIRRHELAKSGQMISVNLVEFDAGQFTRNVAAPTRQDLEAQFDRYKNVVRGDISPTTNPAGFGYKYPDRLKLQYIQIPRQQIRASVEASRDPHRWEVDLHKFYQQHLEDFKVAATQPAASPSTNTSFSLDSQRSTPASAPTLRPFAQVRNDIKERIVESESEKRQAAILERITATLGADYMAYRGAAGNAPTAPTTVPASSLKVPYNSFEYLQKLAAQIQADFHVLPAVASLQERFRTPNDLLQVQGLGQAHAGMESVATYLQTWVMTFVPPDKISETGVLHRWQPASALRDDAGNYYIMRVSDAQGAHPPQSIDEVIDQVRTDAVTARAYQMARDAAQKLLNESKVGGLASAARPANLKMITTSPFVNQPGAAVRGYTVPDPAGDHFIQEAFKLISTPRAHPGAQPVRLVELPEISKALATELANVTPMFTPDNEHLAAAQLARQEEAMELSEFMRSWYNFDAVSSRVHYTATETDKEKQEPSRPLPVEPPIF